MDLRSILTTSDNGDRAPAGPPKPPQPPAASPLIPGQGGPPPSFRDYGHGPQASPSRPGPLHPQEYPGHGQPPPTAYPPPSAYQSPVAYGGRHAPPPLQPT